MFKLTKANKAIMKLLAKMHKKKRLPTELNGKRSQLKKQIGSIFYWIM
jgi:hypothetical protein